MAVAEKSARRWTYEEYYRLNDDQRYEIFDGNLRSVRASPIGHTARHATTRFKMNDQPTSLLAWFAPLRHPGKGLATLRNPKRLGVQSGDASFVSGNSC